MTPGSLPTLSDHYTVSTHFNLTTLNYTDRSQTQARKNRAKSEVCKECSESHAPIKYRVVYTEHVVGESPDATQCDNTLKYYRAKKISFIPECVLSSLVRQNVGEVCAGRLYMVRDTHRAKKIYLIQHAGIIYDMPPTDSRWFQHTMSWVPEDLV